MALSRIELEQIQQNREFLDQYTAAESTSLAQSGVDLQGVMNHVFSAVKRILRGDASGVGDWREAPAASLFDLNDASGILRFDQDQINNFIGRADGDSDPTYTSTVFVTQNNDLEAAISELDLALVNVVAGSGATWQVHYNTGSGLLNVGDSNPDAAITFLADGKWVLGPSTADAVFSASGAQIREFGFRPFEVLPVQINPGDTVTIPDGRTYTPDSVGINLRVFHNGQLLLPGSGVLSTDEQFNDYREVSSTTIVSNVKLKTDAVMQYHING